MQKWLVTFLVVVATGACAADTAKPSPGAGVACDELWYQGVEQRVPTGDGRGHGPDIGSDEWKSVVEFRLGIRGEPDVPQRDSEDWCRHIDGVLLNTRAPAAASDRTTPAAAAPSFSCDGIEGAGIESMICADATLSTLDRKLSAVYAAASDKAAGEHPPELQALQRGWIKGRDECWKSADSYDCVRNAYVRRIAELQARYRLVPYRGPMRYQCDDNPAKAVVATFFATDPPTLTAEYGDSVALMYLQPSASGSKYRGRNETFWEKRGEALVVWGYDAPRMTCKRAP